MKNKELEVLLRKAQALGDDIREMESIDASEAYHRDRVKA